MNQKKLYRSRNNYMVGGICGGLGEYFDIDPTIVRLLVAFSFLLAGSGLLLYLIAWLIIPLAPEHLNR